MGSGGSRVMTGAITGTGADLDVRTVGFRPGDVKLLNEDGLATAVWTETMADGLALKEITTGVKSMTAAGDGVTPLSDGFRLGADSDLNVDGEKVHWIATE